MTSSRRPVKPDAKYYIAAQARHTCRMCTHSCRSFDVMLTEQEAQRLSMSIWRGLLKDIPDEMPLVLYDASTRQHTLNRRADGRCVFLDNDNLCIVHKEAGADVKPTACRFFPMHAIQAPDGVHLSLNPDCRRLTEMGEHDDPLDAEQAAELLTGVEAVTTIGDTLLLMPDQAISYAEFLEWQDKLLAVLTGSTPNLRGAAALLLTITDDMPAPELTWQTLYIHLQALIDQHLPQRPTTAALLARVREWLPALTNPDAALAPQFTLPGSAAFCAMIARQYLEGQQVALHRTARTGWVALLTAIVAGLVGAQWILTQHPEADAMQLLNDVLSDALEVFFNPLGQIALTEPNQQAFLRALAFNT